MHGHSVLHPAGPMASAIDGLWWWMFWVASTVWVLVVVALAFAAFRRARPPVSAEDVALTPAVEHERMERSVGIAIAVTVAVLFAFLFYDFGVGRALAEHPSKALTVQVIGPQWWWEIRYEDPDPDKRFTTANEIHIPTGEPVQLELSSVDVIHSFWAPNLNGKRDLVPGYLTSTWIESDTAGTFRAQCAEFCGYQHAKMALVVIAEPKARFEGWLAAQRQEVPPPSDSLAAAGKKVFLAGPCSKCHAVAGTGAAASVGPDLSHVGGRITLGAGTLANTLGNLMGWVTDPQDIKPGVLMPPTPLASKDLLALATYLESLK